MSVDFKSNQRLCTHKTFSLNNLIPIYNSRYKGQHRPKLLTPWSRLLPDKLTVSQLLKRFPAFYLSLRFYRRISSIKRLLCLVHNMLRFLWWQVISTSPNPPSWRPTPFRLSATTYSIYSQLPAISATWGRAMPWWQGPIYHYERDPLITIKATPVSLWQGPTYHTRNY